MWGNLVSIVSIKAKYDRCNEDERENHDICEACDLTQNLPKYFCLISSKRITPYRPKNISIRYRDVFFHMQHWHISH